MVHVLRLISESKITYCIQSSEYTCVKYDHIEDYDSFITTRHQKADLEKARRIGIDAYNTEQEEKARILDLLLSGYNDGRKKTLFCVAVNLLELQELRNVIDQIESDSEMEMRTLKEKSAFAAKLLQNAAERNGIDVKLHKKK